MNHRPEPLRKPFPAELLAALQTRFGERVSTAASVLEQHGKDESAHPVAPPDAVVFPENTAEVAQIVGLCGKHGIPVIAFGAGSSLEGHVLAIHGGVSLDLSRMNRILAVHVDDLDAV